MLTHSSEFFWPAAEVSSSDGAAESMPAARRLENQVHCRLVLDSQEFELLQLTGSSKIDQIRRAGDVQILAAMFVGFVEYGAHSAGLEREKGPAVTTPGVEIRLL